MAMEPGGVTQELQPIQKTDGLPITEDGNPETMAALMAELSTAFALLAMLDRMAADRGEEPMPLPVIGEDSGLSSQ